MKAKEVAEIAKKAKDEGYDSTVNELYKRVMRAAKFGETDVNITIIPWWNFEARHAEFFINRDFKVEVSKDHIHISWERDF